MGTKSKNRVALTADRVARMKPNTILWDDTVIGFGARRQRGDGVYFVMRYRTQRGQERWQTIGRWGSPWQPGEARTEAKRILGDVANGRDPQAVRAEGRQKTMSVADLVAYYIDVTAKVKKLKPKTVSDYQTYLKSYIRPKFGKIDADRLAFPVVNAYHKEDLKLTPVLANRVVMLITAAYNKAGPENGITITPTRGLVRHAEEARQACLSLAQVKALGQAMRTLTLDEGERNAVAVIAVLLITGRRKNEVRMLKHDDVRIESDGTAVMTLADHKTSRVQGAAVYTFAADARAIVESVKRVPGNSFVFPSTTRHAAPVNVDKVWAKLCKAAGIEGFTIHDLRRTAGDHSGELNIELAKTAQMLGHADTKTTQKHYRNKVNEALRLRPVVEQVGSSLAAILNGAKAA